MKKFFIFLAVVIFVVCGIYYMYLNFQTSYNEAKKNNKEFEQYLDQEVLGSELATIINRAIDSNEKNEVQKNDKGIYQDNNENSINIEIKITDNDKIYNMEAFYNSGIEKFINNYSNIKFKCTQLEYHNLTNKVKYMLFEQITE